MTHEPLDESYFTWLYRQVAPVSQKNPARTFWNILRQLHSKEFTWFVPNDDNRCGDGKELRYEFLEESIGSPIEAPWMDLGCSVLEMMIALSRRLSFTAGGAAAEWFWHLMENLDLRKYNDAYYDPNTEGHKFRVVADTLDRLVDRTYHYDGSGGGLFPLQHAECDQREVEIWYQMNYYLLERG